jgi:hypothetical protein
MPRRPDPKLVWAARLDGVVGCVQGALWTANVDQVTALRENMPRLGDALDALLVVLKEKPTHLRPLIDDWGGGTNTRGRLVLVRRDWVAATAPAG